MGELELCILCDAPTGKAGACEDSLYCEECGDGPMCEECFSKHIEEEGDHA